MKMANIKILTFKFWKIPSGGHDNGKVPILLLLCYNATVECGHLIYIMTEPVYSTFITLMTNMLGLDCLNFHQFVHLSEQN